MRRYSGVYRVAAFVDVLLQDHCVSVDNIQGVLKHLADHACYLSHVSPVFTYRAKQYILGRTI